MINKQSFVAEVGLLVFPDCQAAAVLGLTDLFRIAGEWSAPDANMAQRPDIRVSHWELVVGEIDHATETLECVWDSHPGSNHRLDYIIAPPSLVMPDKMRAMPSEAAWLREQHDSGTRVCSICAGAFVLAESGLLDGRRVTTHWAFAKQLADRFPTIDVAAENILLDDGDIMTAGGILAWTDLGLTLVDRLLGPSAMLSTARFLVIDPPRRHQRPYDIFIPNFDHGDGTIVRVQHHLHANAAGEQSIKQLAAMAGTTERTFLRRFLKATKHRPTEYLQNVRITKARELLEFTNRSIDQIAWDVGYADPAAFRKIFQRLTLLAPNIYRQRFGVQETK